MDAVQQDPTRAETQPTDYQEALLSCSQALLKLAEDGSSQQKILTEALSYLLDAVQAGRAYIFRNFVDPELGKCMGMLAEVCAPGVPAHIGNPANQKMPWAWLPENMAKALAKGDPFGGPVAEIFASTPEFKDNFLSQNPPLLSVQCFPIFAAGSWWGFVGFDDVTTARDWHAEEVLLLRTAAEMFASTLQRWEAEQSLKEALKTVEERVSQRTQELSQANMQLQQEIQQGSQLRAGLERKLKSESTLAAISTQLLKPINPQTAIQECLEILGHFLQGGRILLAQFKSMEPFEVEMYDEWYAPGQAVMLDEQLHSYAKQLHWFREQLVQRQAVVYFRGAKLPVSAQQENQLLNELELSSLVLLPLVAEGRMIGALSCSNIRLSEREVTEVMQFLEITAGLFSSLLQRENLLKTLEQKVAERTRELAAFYDMAMLSSTAQPLEEVLRPMLSRIMELATCEAVCIHLADHQAGRLSLLVQRGFSQAEQEQLARIPMDEAMQNWLQQPERSGQAAGSKQNLSLPEAFCLKGYRQMLTLKMHIQDKSRGMLTCYRSVDLPFMSHQHSLLQAISEQVSVIIENHRLRQQAEDLAALHERQRVARELHDSVSQSLYSLTLFARSAQDALEEENFKKLQQSLTEVEENSLLAQREMRLLLYQLRAEIVDQGLLHALEARLQQVEQRLGIRASVQLEATLRLTRAVEQELFLLISEALNNSLRYAHANEVRVILRRENQQLYLSVEDDGVGFSPEAVQAGIGMNSMRERAEILAGELEVFSQPGAGTQIHLTIQDIGPFLTE